MRPSGTTIPAERLQACLADDNARRGRLVSSVLLVWVITSLVIDVQYFVPRGEVYYLYLDLFILPPILGFTVLIWNPAGSAGRIQTGSFLFSLIFVLWAAVLATFQETPYTLFVAAFLVSATLLLRPRESLLVYALAFNGYVIALTVQRGSPVADGMAMFIEVLAMTIAAGLVSNLLYRQRLKTFEAEELLRRQNQSQEQEIALRTDDLDRRLKEREVLLREVHHRVKNNLQILASILRLSDTYRNGKDPEALLRSVEQRIVSMAMVHQQLDDAGSLEQIDLAPYVKGLSSYLIASHRPVNDITFAHELQSIRVSIDAAINLGLLVTEALSNALQHAFDHEHSDRRVRVSVHAHESRLVLIVADNGKGMLREQIETGPNRGLGLFLIESLSSQLHGSFTYDCSAGTTFRFETALDQG
jgi:two-component sensor histidine kinase